VVPTINIVIPRLSAVTGAVVTGTEGPAQTRTPVDRESGPMGYDVSYVNATDDHGKPATPMTASWGVTRQALLLDVKQALVDELVDAEGA
jgi:mRNA interferase MazF